MLPLLEIYVHSIRPMLVADQETYQTLIPGLGTLGNFTVPEKRLSR